MHSTLLVCLYKLTGLSHNDFKIINPNSRFRSESIPTKILPAPKTNADNPI